MESKLTSHQPKRDTEKMGCLPHPDDIKQIAQMLKVRKQTKAKTKKQTCRYVNLK